MMLLEPLHLLQPCLETSNNAIGPTLLLLRANVSSMEPLRQFRLFPAQPFNFGKLGFDLDRQFLAELLVSAPLVVEQIAVLCPNNLCVFSSSYSFFRESN